MTRLGARFRTLFTAGLALPLIAACSQGVAPSPSASSPTQAPAANAAPTAAAQTSAQPASAPQAGGTFVIAQIGPLAKTLHPYPDAASYSQSWTDAARLIWSGGLVSLNADTLEYEPDMASVWTV